MCYISICCLQNAPVIKNCCTPAHLDVLIVNLIRGTFLPGGCVWILGRRAAVSQIPSQFLDVVTEIQGFRCFIYTSCLHTFSHGWYHLALLARISKKRFLTSKRNYCTGLLRWCHPWVFVFQSQVFLLKSHNLTNWDTLFKHLMQKNTNNVFCFCCWLCRKYRLNIGSCFIFHSGHLKAS